MHAVPIGTLSSEPDPTILTAYPVEGKASVLGDMPVRLRAEGTTLAAYGFGHQRIAVPASEIATIQAYVRRGPKGEVAAASLALIGHSGSPLLWARGPWGPGLEELRKKLRIRSLTHPTGRLTAHFRTRRSLPRGTPVLRTRPRGWLVLGITAFAVALLMTIGGALAGVGLSLLLPSGIGGIRDLIGIALAIGGVLGGIWLFYAIRSVLADGLRWLVASLRAGGPAPWDRFWRVETPAMVLGTIVTIMVALSIPLLLIWGPIIAGVSLSHGYRDAALVRDLRQHGVQVAGTVVNDPYYTTDSDGDEEEHDRAALSFSPVGQTRQQLTVDDPGIAGITWPIDPYDPVTVVYDPADPQKAAVQQQITGSVWHGAPIGNVIGGAVAVLIFEPPLIWLFILRVTASRRKAGREFTRGLA
ncbi:MAG TPA: hypothetical protein VH478_10600 [Trebonia sp.]|nr:hypothetical protein [Trebonia sp.]